jgi:hypothetical protein
MHRQLVFLLPFWCMLWPFGIFVAILVYISQYGLLCQDKSGNLVGCKDIVGS